MSKSNLLMAAAKERAEAGGGGDPYWANVVLLLQMEGPDQSTTFTDEAGHTMSVGGDAKIVTAQSAVGSSSMEVTAPATFGTPQRLYHVISSDWDIAGGDFTIEARIRPTAANSGGNARHFFSQAKDVSQNNRRSFSVGFHTSSGVQFYWTENGLTDQFFWAPTTFTLNEWAGVSVSRIGNTIYVHKDGTFIYSQAFTSTIYVNPVAHLCVGTFGEFAVSGYGYLDFTGQMDAVRFTKGVGRYDNNNYTLAPFPNF